MSTYLRRTLLLGAAAGVLLAAGACGRNHAGTLLAPTGTPPGPPAVAGIKGVLDFGSPGTHPAALVLVARVRGTASSAFGTMEIAGSFCTPAWTPGGAGDPFFTQLAPSVWVDTLTVPAGNLQWKFVGNSNWSNAYCSNLTNSTDVDGLSGTLKMDPGGGKNIIADVSTGGLMVCTLDENADPPTYAIVPVGVGAPAVLTAGDGSFTITGLVAGTYNILFRIPGETEFRIDGEVVGNAMKDLGTISTSGQTFTLTASAGAHGTMVPTGAITVARGASQHFSLVPEPHYKVEALKVDGVTVSTDTAYTMTNITASHTVEASFALNDAVLPGGIHATLLFDPGTLFPITAAPYPPVHVQLNWGTTALVDQDLPTSGNSLDLADLDVGSYQLVITSPMYPRLEIPVVVGTSVRDLGNLNMMFDFFQLSNTVNVAGGFNGWRIPDPNFYPDSAASLDVNLAWVDTSWVVPAGTYDLKFARSGGWVEASYGGDPATTLTMPVANQATRKSAGGPNSTHAIRVTFPTTGKYTFILDERRQVFSIQPGVVSMPRYAGRRTR
jgi:hypothetical protein